MTESKTLTDLGSNAGLGCERLCIDFCNKYEVAQAEIERLQQVARNVYEVWAGSEGIPIPETAAEAYLLQLVEQMRDEAKHGLPNLKVSEGENER